MSEGGRGDGGPINAIVTVIAKPLRERDRNHLRFVARQPCLVCGRSPCDPHHIKYAEHRAMGRKVSDCFTVPLCRLHHRELHRRGDERAWWEIYAVDPLDVAATLWHMTHAGEIAEGDGKGTRTASPSKLNGTRSSSGVPVLGHNEQTASISRFDVE